MKTKLITLGLIGLFFYSCLEKNDSDKKVATEGNLQTITEQKSNTTEIEIVEEELQTITEQKSNIDKEVIIEKLETITEQQEK
ncbi:hypothetical protein [Winogradskyella sp. R77965]|uniref:hypothetical protein n=1 Tax=Winogradskyella sp. R77965 TaxID=3093872 RepID=UPI0037DD503A